MLAQSLKRPFAVSAGVLVVGIGAASVAALPANARDAANRFHEVKLVADRPGHAATTDKNLVNAWGLASSPSSPLWVANNGTSTSTLYQGAQPGKKIQKVPLVVSIPGGGDPTGALFNPTKRFRLSTGGKTGSALFLFAGEGGDLTAWNKSGNQNKAVLVAHEKHSVFKGLTMVTSGGRRFLLVSNFHKGRVDVFNQKFGRTSLPGSFPSKHVPGGYAPFDVATIGGKVYVTYAKQDAARHDDVAGRGHGFINVFTQNGRFLRTLVRRGPLNSPWGLTVAPRGFAPYTGKLLVGNFGNGRIHVVNRHTGQVVATLRNRAGKPIVIDGLWGLRPGNGTAGAKSDVWFSAGPNAESHGLLGILRHR